MRPATLGPMPGVRAMVFTSSAATARRSSSGSSTASTARAMRGPIPETDCTMRKISVSSGWGKPYRVIESSRTTISVCRVSSAPWRVEARAWGVVRTRYPTPPTSSTRASSAMRATRPVNEAITGPL